MSETNDIPQQHRAQGPSSIRSAVITVSDSRTLETDHGGAIIVELLKAAGHEAVSRQIVRDEPSEVRAAIEHAISQSPAQAILLTGGTGISGRDQTYETVSGMLTKIMPGYGELFRLLSYEEIGSAAMLSRAVGGLIGRTVVITMPGSPGAVRLAMERLILPELRHLVREASR